MPRTLTAKKLTAVLRLGFVVKCRTRDGYPRWLELHESGLIRVRSYTGNVTDTWQRAEDLIRWNNYNRFQICQEP